MTGKQNSSTDLQTGGNITIQRRQPVVVVSGHQQSRSFIVGTPDGVRRSLQGQQKASSEGREFPPRDIQDISTYTLKQKTLIVTQNTETQGSLQTLTLLRDKCSLYHTCSGRQVKIPARNKDWT